MKTVKSRRCAAEWSRNEHPAFTFIAQSQSGVAETKQLDKSKRKSVPASSPQNQSLRHSLECIYKHSSERFCSKDNHICEPHIAIQTSFTQIKLRKVLSVSKTQVKKKKHSISLFCCLRKSTSQTSERYQKEAKKDEPEFKLTTVITKTNDAATTSDNHHDFCSQFNEISNNDIEVNKPDVSTKPVTPFINYATAAKVQQNNNQKQSNIVQALVQNVVKKVHPKRTKTRKAHYNVIVLHLAKKFSDNSAKSDAKRSCIKNTKMRAKERPVIIRDFSAEVSERAFNTDLITKRANKLCGVGEIFVTHNVCI